MKITSSIRLAAVIVFFAGSACFAQDAAAVRGMFLKGEYRQCAAEGVKLLASQSRGADFGEVVYLAGLSCLKTGDFENGRKLFERLVKDNRRGGFGDEARIGVADCLYLQGDLKGARSRYEDFLKNRMSSNLRPGVYYRLYLLTKKAHESADSRVYREKLKTEFPWSPEAAMERDIFPVVELPEVSKEPGERATLTMPIPAQYYTVQVGAFSKKVNAERLAAKLKTKGYPAYVESVFSKGITIFKVKAGRFTSFPEIKQLERQLSTEGYPTKIDKMP